MSKCSSYMGALIQADRFGTMSRFCLAKKCPCRTETISSSIVRCYIVRFARASNNTYLKKNSRNSQKCEPRITVLAHRLFVFVALCCSVCVFFFFCVVGRMSGAAETHYDLPSQLTFYTTLRRFWRWHRKQRRRTTSFCASRCWPVLLRFRVGVFCVLLFRYIGRDVTNPISWNLN